MSDLRKDKRIAKWNKLTLRNNFMFRLVMEKQELCKKLIECILGIRIKSISYMEHEKSFEANLKSKGVRLDLFVIDEDGVAYDIEMQMDNSYKEFLGRRTRYYVSTMDTASCVNPMLSLYVPLILLTEVLQNIHSMPSVMRITALYWMMA